MVFKKRKKHQVNNSTAKKFLMFLNQCIIMLKFGLCDVGLPTIALLLVDLSDMFAADLLFNYVMICFACIHSLGTTNCVSTNSMSPSSVKIQAISPELCDIMTCFICIHTAGTTKCASTNSMSLRSVKKQAISLRLCGRTACSWASAGHVEHGRECLASLSWVATGKRETLITNTKRKC